MNVIETIRSEINRRKELHDSNAFKTESDMIVNLEIGAAQALDDLLLFLDTIDVEYIRKDALLEWLEGKMTIEGATEGLVGGYDFALKDVIKHIESL